MSNLNAYQQTTLERKRYTVGYQRWLDVGETLFDHTFIVTPSTDVPLVVEDAFSSAGDTEISFYVKGGEAGTLYEIKLVATTSDGQVKEDTVQMGVFNG